MLLGWYLVGEFDMLSHIGLQATFAARMASVVRLLTKRRCPMVCLVDGQTNVQSREVENRIFICLFCCTPNGQTCAQARCSNCFSAVMVGRIAASFGKKHGAGRHSSDGGWILSNRPKRKDELHRSRPNEPRIVCTRTCRSIAPFPKCLLGRSYTTSGVVVVAQWINVLTVKGVVG